MRETRKELSRLSLLLQTSPESVARQLLIRNYLDLLELMRSWPSSEVEGNVALSPANLPAGYHLCLSVDTGIPKMAELTSFFFQERQSVWTAQYAPCKPAGGGQAGAVDIADDTALYFIGFQEVEPLELALRTTIRNCWKAAIENDGRMRNGLRFPAPHAERHFIYPRAVRFMYSSPEALSRSVAAMPLFPSSYFGGLAQTGVLNVWLNEQVVSSMNVLDWVHTNGGSSVHFNEPAWTANGSELSSLTLGELIRKFVDSNPGGVATESLDRLASRYQDEGQVHDKEYLALGDRLMMIGYSSSPTTLRAECRGGFLEVLPVLMMAMHAKSVVCFDLVYNLAKESQVREPRGDLESQLAGVLTELSA